MTSRADLFSTVSPTAVGLKQQEEAVNTKPRKPRKRTVSQPERYQIAKLLEENLTQKDSDGLISYTNNMNDEKIAAIIGPHISYDTVRNMRQQIFGVVRKAYPLRAHNKTDSDMLARIAKLEEASLMHERIIGSHNITINHLVDMFNQLAEEIGSNLRIN